MVDVSSIDAGTQFITGGSVGVAVGVAAVVNAAVQTTAAVRTSMREQEIDEAAIAFEVSLATAGLELGVQEAIITANAIYRDLLTNQLELLDNNAAIAQAFAERQAILREVEILVRNFAANFDGLASSYFADPIFYIRAEREVLEADAAFRNAQRWLFYTCRALEYKWQQRFAISDATLGKSYDIDTIFKARNVDELEEIRVKMADFDSVRRLGAGPTEQKSTVISLRDQFITPNPQDVNLTFDSFLVDDGLRYSDIQGKMVTKKERFRELLKRDFVVNGNIVIDFNTSILQNFDGEFFRGPRFDTTIPQPGNYRNKIVWTAVHLLSSTATSSPQVSSIQGAMRYGGNSFFRTRIPVYPASRQTATTANASEEFVFGLDYPGEFITAPVRFYQDTALNGRYILRDSIVDQVAFAESSTSAKGLSSVTRSVISDPNLNFRSGRLKERSVAASRWTLEINGSSSNPSAINLLIDRLDDIEIVVQHQSYERPDIDPPSNN